MSGTENLIMPDGYVSIDSALPPIDELVMCFMSDGSERIGFRYDNADRSGWKNFKDYGFYNLAWSRIFVLGWKPEEG